jgi:hypothetical protein
MKIIVFLVSCLPVFLGLTISPALGQEASANPTINLTVKNAPLGDVLETITRDTGYRFELPTQWEGYEVSATIRTLPLEQGLKRLLRSLNYTLIWESGRMVTIRIYGKAEPGSSGAVNSFSAPPPPYPEDTGPTVEPENPPADDLEPQDSNDEATEPDTAPPEDVVQVPDGDESSPQTDNPREPPAAVRLGAGKPAAQPQGAGNE